MNMVEEASWLEAAMDLNTLQTFQDDSEIQFKINPRRSRAQPIRNSLINGNQINICQAVFLLQEEPRLALMSNLVSSVSPPEECRASASHLNSQSQTGA